MPSDADAAPVKRGPGRPRIHPVGHKRKKAPWVDPTPTPFMRKKDEPQNVVDAPAYRTPREGLYRLTGKPGPPVYVPTAKASKRIRALAMLGLAKEKIARDAGISLNTLKKYYERELAEGDLEAYAQVAGRLFRKAMDGDTIAMIFWMKARIGWKDRPDTTTVNHNVSISHEERLRLLEADPLAPAQQGDRDQDTTDPEGGVQPRFTEDGNEIIDGEEPPEELEGDTLEEAEIITRSYADQVAEARKVEKGE